MCLTGSSLSWWNNWRNFYGIAICNLGIKRFLHFYITDLFIYFIITMHCHVWAILCFKSYPSLEDLKKFKHSHKYIYLSTSTSPSKTTYTNSFSPALQIIFKHTDLFPYSDSNISEKPPERLKKKCRKDLSYNKNHVKSVTVG